MGCLLALLMMLAPRAVVIGQVKTVLPRFS